MAPKFYQTEKFKKLNEKWADKLEKSGFKDVESDEDNLKEWDTSIFSRYNQYTIEARQEYYRFAGHFFESHKFSDNREKLIWKLHSEGLSFDKISVELKKLRYKKHNRNNIHLTIKRLTAEMFKINGITVREKRSNSN